MNRVLHAAIVAIVVVATVVIALVVWGEPTGAQIGALVGLVVVELYLFGLNYYATQHAGGDHLNFIPAVLAAIPVALISIVALFVPFSTAVAIILYVVGWALAAIVLGLSLVHDAREKRNGDDTPSSPDFTIKQGRA